MNTIHNHNWEIIDFYSVFLQDYISVSFTRSGWDCCTDWPSGSCLLQSAISSTSVTSTGAASVRPNRLHLLMKMMPHRHTSRAATTTEPTTTWNMLAVLVQLTILRLLTTLKNCLSPSWRLRGGLRKQDFPLPAFSLYMRTQPHPSTPTFQTLVVSMFLTLFSSPLRT